MVKDREFGLVGSDLWLAQADFRKRFLHQQESGALTPEEATDLDFFATHGYLVNDLDIDHSLLDELVDGVGFLWNTRPGTGDDSDQSSRF